jgi:CMP-N-acetylneuraminic acid synthetase
MRHWSRRVAGKNYRPLGGKPLYQHIVESLLAADCVERVVLDTDSDLILEQAAERFGDAVVALRRPEHLRDEHLNANDILDNTLRQLTGDVFIQTHATNPLLRPVTIDTAFNAYVDGLPGFDSLFTVTPIYRRLWTRDGEPINHDPRELLRTQDLDPIFEENSCLYIFSRSVFQRRRHRLGDHPLPFSIPAEEALDIDTELDWKILESVYRGRGDDR